MSAKGDLASFRRNRVKSGEAGEVALLLAPLGRDATILRRLLQEVNIPCESCENIAELAARLGDETIFFTIITEEALISADLKPIAGWIGSQPSWSDLPIIVLTKREDGTERNQAASRLVSILGNVSFLAACRT